MIGGSGGPGGPGTPTRAGHGVVPGVVISPSAGNAPVREDLCTSNNQSDCVYPLARGRVYEVRLII